MKSLQNKSYDIQGLVQYIGRPDVDTDQKMIKFLQMTGVLNGLEPNPLLKRRRFIWSETTCVDRGNKSKSVQKVMFSEYGREWVEVLLSLYYNTSVDNGQRSEYADIP